MSINDIYTKKQQEVLQAYKRNDWRIMINYGAIRAGKTLIDNDLFLLELRRVRKMADKLNVREPMYILAGVSSKTIQNNVLTELTNRYGLTFHFDKHGSFNLFGVKVVTAFTGSIGGLGAIRGLTAFGAYINEASLANPHVFAEINNRCSIEGARIILDTNPDSPQHWLKRDYIDNKKEDARIISFRFTLDDNTAIGEDFRSGIKASTPSGMLYERNILGMWVSGEGMVYRDFDKERMTFKELPPITSYYVGVDWGYSEGHAGALLLFGDDDEGNTYLIEEHVHEYREVGTYWLPLAKSIAEEYGAGVPFYCDTARPEYVAMFKRNGLNVRKTSKKKMIGIEAVATKMKTGKFFISQNVPHFLDEIYNYIWDEKTGEPVKKNDDTMDAMRYAVYNHHRTAGGRTELAKGTI